MKRRSKADWEALITKQASSGESARGFCERSGISLSSFRYWKEKLSGRSGFVEIPVVSKDESREMSLVVEIPGGASLRISW